MEDLSFDDLVPQSAEAAPQPTAELSFDDLVPAAAPEEPTAEASGEQPGALSDGYFSVMGSLNRSLGSTLRGLGTVSQSLADYTTTPLYNWLTGSDYRAPNLMDKPAQALTNLGDKGKSFISAETKKAVEESMPGGDLFNPKTWSLGKNPSLRGYAALTADVFGSMLPVLATSIMTGGAAIPAGAVGGAQGGGAAVDQARETIDKFAKEGKLAEASPYYRQLIESGMDPQEALARTKTAAEKVAFMFTAPVTAFGGAATAKITGPGTQVLSGAGATARITGRAAISGLEEGAEETAEGIATKSGINTGAGTKLDVTEGSFGDFILGMVGGAGPGAVSGAFSGGNVQTKGVEATTAKGPDAAQAEALASEPTAEERRARVRESIERNKQTKTPEAPAAANTTPQNQADIAVDVKEALDATAPMPAQPKPVEAAPVEAAPVTPPSGPAAAAPEPVAPDGIVPRTYKTFMDGRSVKAFSLGNRVITIVDVNGVPTPFYISTGTGGKKGVQPGKWYPFFGFGPTDGWFNKGTEEEIINYYGSPSLRRAAEFLDQNYGDMRAEQQKGLVPNGVPAASPDWMRDSNGTSIDGLFDGLNPVDRKDSGKSDAYWKSHVARVERAKAATAPAQEPAPPAVDDTGQNTPESAETLDAQQQKLIERKVPAQMFPTGTEELALPEGFERVETPRGVFHFDPEQLTAEQVTEISEAQRENEILGLGEQNKQDVVEAAQQGDPPVAVTERTPEGTEVKGAVASESVAPETAVRLGNNSEPENSVQIEPVEQAPAEREITQPGYIVTGDGNVITAPKAVEVVRAARRRAQPKAEPQPEAAPEPQRDIGPKGQRVLYSLAEEKQRKAEATRAQKGLRGVRVGEPPRIRNKVARDAFIRRAKGALAEMGESVPQFYRDAVEAASRIDGTPALTNHEHYAALEKAWQAEHDAHAAGEPVYVPRNRTTSKIEKEEAKRAHKEAVEKAKEEGTYEAPETEAKIKRDLAREKAVGEMADKLLAEYPDKYKSRDEAMGLAQFLVEDEARRNNAEITDRNKSSSFDAMTESGVGLGAVAPVQEQYVDAGRKASPEVAVESEVDLSVQDAEDADVVQDVQGADGEERSAKVSASARGKLRTGNDSEGAASEVRSITDADEKKRIAMEALARLNAKVMASETDTGQMYDAVVDALGKDQSRLAAELNQMSEDEFADWWVNASIDERGKAVAAAKLLGVTHFKKSNFERIFDNWLKNEPVDALQETTAGELLTRLRRDTATKMSPLMRGIARLMHDRIAKLTKDVKVYIVDAKGMDRARFGAPGTADGVFRAPVGDIVLLADAMADPDQAYRLLVHEALHAALADTIDGSAKFKAQVRKLLEAVKAKVMADPALAARHGDPYGFHDEHEFISEAMTSTRFQATLADVKFTPEEMTQLGLTRPSRLSSAFNALIDLIRRGLHLPNGTISALEEAVRIADRAMTLRELQGAATRGKGMHASMRHGEGSFEKRAYDELVKRGVSAKDAELYAKDVAELAEEGATIEELQGVFDDLAQPWEPAPEISETAVADAVEHALGETPTVAPKSLPTPRLLKLRTFNQLAQAADRFFGGPDANPVRRIDNLIQQRRSRKQQHLKGAEPVLRRLMELEKDYSQSDIKRRQWDSFLEVAHDSTMADIHPDVPLDHAKNAHLGKDKLGGYWSKQQHTRLHHAYKALPPDLKQALHDTADYFVATQDKMRRSLIENILVKAGKHDAALAKRFMNGTETQQDKDAVGPILAKHIKAVNELTKINGLYFPLMRQGDWVVEAKIPVKKPTNAIREVEKNVFEFKDRKDAIAYGNQQDSMPDVYVVHVDPKTGKDYFTDPATGERIKVTAKEPDGEKRFRVRVQDTHVEFTDSRAAANARAQELAKAGYSVGEVEMRRFESNAPNGDMLYDQLRAIMDTMDKREGYENLTDAQRVELKGVLNEASLKMLASTRIQARRLPRRFVAGASQDVIRTTATYADSAAGYLAKLETQPSVDESMKVMEDMAREGKWQGKGRGAGARAIANEVQERVRDQDRPLSKSKLDGVLERIKLLSFLDKLMSPAYSVINGMQPFMVAYPSLAGKHGAFRAAYHLTKAYRDMGALQTTIDGVKDTGRAVAGKDGRPIAADTIRRIKDPKERAMLEQLMRNGAIDPDAGLEMNTLTDRRDDWVGKADKSLGYLEGIARQMPRAVETINRTATALAAYRLERGRKADHETAMRYAQDETKNTQGDYSASNAPKYFNTGLGSFVLQFKKYAQMMYHLLGQNLGRVWRPSGPGERARGLKTLAMLMLTHGLFAGFAGLPWEPIKYPMMLLNGFGFGMGWDDVEDLMRKTAKEFFNSDKLGEMFVKGVTRGIPGGWAFDLSGRMGMDSLAAFGEPRSNKREDVKAYLFDTLFGAPTAYLVDQFRGAYHLSRGEFGKAAELMIPMKVVADSIKAWNGGEDRKSESGRKIRDGYTTKEQLVRGFGFTPARDAESGAKRALAYKKTKEANDQRTKLMQSWVNAETDADREKAMEAIGKYNETADPGNRISKGALVQSMSRRRTEERKGTYVDGIRTDKRNRALVESLDYYDTQRK